MYFVAKKQLGAFDPFGDSVKFLQSQVDKAQKEAQKALGVKKSKDKSKSKSKEAEVFDFPEESSFLDGQIFGVPVPIILGVGVIGAAVVWNSRKKKAA